MNQIIWPEGYLPGLTDNYVSNETIISKLSVVDVWRFFFDTNYWPQYYSNMSDIIFRKNDGPYLYKGARLSFKTFGFPVEAEVTEYEPPAPGKTARAAWHGWVEGNEESRIDVHHAWLFEDISMDRVRILTQETQNGKPAKELAKTKPNPMLNGHQDWIDGLVKTALGK